MMHRRVDRPSFTPRYPSKQNVDARPVVAVGRRVLVTGANGATHVVLSDDNGIPTGATMALGLEVEVVAWKPRGPNGARYRVRCDGDGVEGWLDAPSVQARPEPPTPKKPVVPAAPTPRRTTAAARKGSR